MSDTIEKPTLADLEQWVAARISLVRADMPEPGEADYETMFGALSAYEHVLRVIREGVR